MSITRRFSVLLILIPLVMLATRRQDSHSRSRATTAGDDWSELMGDMERMHAAMSSVEPSDDSDADFVKLMLPHHRAAVDMAKTQLLYGMNPQIRGLAQEIITDQQSEIELMQLWLKQRGALPSKPDTR
jgi:uncharacterized protein (DUF305 family)